jgi:Ca2+-binding RTX toxin-like protein
MFTDYSQSGGLYTVEIPAGGRIEFKSFEQLSIEGRAVSLVNGYGISDLVNGSFSSGYMSSGVFAPAGPGDASNVIALFTNASGTNSASFFKPSVAISNGAVASKPMEIYGSAARDYLVLRDGGSNFNSYVVRTGAGNDQVDARTNTRDSIYLDEGDDVVVVDPANLARNVVVDGGAGFDTLAFSLYGSGAAGSYSFSMGSAVNFERILGTPGNDSISGNSEHNELRGGGGNDLLDGAGGNDVLAGDIDAGPTGPGLGYYDNGNNTPGNDTLVGGIGADTLYGGGGDDILDGGSGADSLVGGVGIDTFVLRAGSGGPSPEAADRIADFQDGTDVIGLRGYLAGEVPVVFAGSSGGISGTYIVVGGEYLAFLQGIQAERINLLDFSY